MSTTPTSQEHLVPAARARSLIRRGLAPPKLRVSGHLNFAQCKGQLGIPDGLHAHSLDLTDCPQLTYLPADLTVDHLILNGCTRLTTLGPQLSCDVLEMRGTAVRTMPEDVRVRFKLDLQECPLLERLPERMALQTLLAARCPRLVWLPRELECGFLDLSGCTALRAWPESHRLRIDRLNLSGCVSLPALPENLGTLIDLNLGGCSEVRALPEGLRITGWLDLTGTGVTRLPASLQGVRLRWRNVFVDERIVFRPESITAEEVLAESNSERRRVMLERMGNERFFQQTRAEVLDRDTDRGGERSLLCVPVRADEPIVCVAVRCPSTGRQYLLRVPPNTRTCREAVAWIAGFDDPNEYDPQVET